MSSCDKILEKFEKNDPGQTLPQGYIVGNVKEEKQDGSRAPYDYFHVKLMAANPEGGWTKVDFMNADLDGCCIFNELHPGLPYQVWFYPCYSIYDCLANAKVFLHDEDEESAVVCCSNVPEPDTWWGLSYYGYTDDIYVGCDDTVEKNIVLYYIEK